MKQKVICSYAESVWMIHGKVYFCRIDSKFISEHSELEFIGTHLDGRKNENVDGVTFEDCKITKVPQGLTKIFPNLKFLSVFNSKLKTVEYEDLKEYSAVREFEFGSNEIEYLPGDLFTGMRNLELISFNDNKIQIIEPNLLDGLHKLKFVSFAKNRCIDLLYHCDDNYKNATLEEIKREFYVTYSNSPLRNIFDKIQKLKFENQKLQAENLPILNESLAFISSPSCPENGVFEDFSRMIKNEELKDFIIKVENVDFKVHKCVLVARSSVFAEMIKSNTVAECLKLVDVTVEIFQEILKFMYTDELPKSDSINFVHLLMAAGRLNIEKLKRFAADKLIGRINPDNALEILSLSSKYGCEKLQQKSFEEIQKIFPDKKLDTCLANQVDKLRKIIEVKRKQKELLRAMECEIDELLN